MGCYLAVMAGPDNRQNRRPTGPPRDESPDSAAQATRFMNAIAPWGALTLPSVMK